MASEVDRAAPRGISRNLREADAETGPDGGRFDL
jgi:hypothetical protein